jgi:hypothetical protein
MYTKYPRTRSTSWSQSNSSDDVWLKDCAGSGKESAWFEGREVVVTEKLDGECTTIYPDGEVHARSLDTSHHPSRSWIKRFAATFAHDIPEGFRICGESVYAYHSIFYTDLPSYFFVYGIYDKANFCIAWDEVEELCKLLGLETVPVIYRGLWDEKKIRELWTGKGRFPTYETEAEYPKFPEDFKPCEAEGYVVRLVQHFHYLDFRNCVGKMVRANHVKSAQNWMQKPVVPNLLKQA